MTKQDDRRFAKRKLQHRFVANNTSTNINGSYAPGLEFWFDLGSNYSYLSMMRIEREAAIRGVRISHTERVRTQRRIINGCTTPE